MKRLIIVTLLGCLQLTRLQAETIKTGVLVINGNASGVAAAIQSARSGAKTILVESTGKLGTGISKAENIYPAGLYPEFIKQAKAVTKDSLLTHLDEAAVARVIKSITDTVKNLTVKLNTSIASVKKNGKGWMIRLASGTYIKTDVVVDATADHRIIKSAGANVDSTLIRTQTVVPPFSNELYRTSVAIGAASNQPYVVPLGALIITNASNLLTTGNVNVSTPDAMFAGQAAGASAAFCAFFKKTTKELDVRLIQGELLNYRSMLVPYADILPSDTNYIAIQHIGLTGLIPLQYQNNKLLFSPDSPVTIADIKPTMKAYYSRSQIWFLDKKDEQQLTLADVLSLIKYSASRGEELNREVEQGWKDSFAFTGKFDLKKNITRREFAVLADTYLKPFSRAVNHKGILIN
ncbi:FAD-dependent oxidoreductase (plasmid) [Pedobacter sp. BS3]|uniref:FAD-dependent oxidoreductase n=1 Tax=Pedobacter sp. BS3 TaxID=2567937 RepID=UPI0011ED82BE|nr:FAD-dependent oxidoreductase [Pedobacter sp. BS3]TZF85875.1 FAD-dependent oxidoreductase [Pedobacter sp. BS3]